MMRQQHKAEELIAVMLFITSHHFCKNLKD